MKYKCMKNLFNMFEIWRDLRDIQGISKKIKFYFQAILNRLSGTFKGSFGKNLKRYAIYNIRYYNNCEKKQNKIYTWSAAIAVSRLRLPEIKFLRSTKKTKTIKAIVQPFEMEGLTRLIPSVVKIWRSVKFIKKCYDTISREEH